MSVHRVICFCCFLAFLASPGPIFSRFSSDFDFNKEFDIIFPLCVDRIRRSTDRSEDPVLRFNVWFSVLLLFFVPSSGSALLGWGNLNDVIFLFVV